MYMYIMKGGFSYCVKFCILLIAQKTNVKTTMEVVTTFAETCHSPIPVTVSLATSSVQMERVVTVCSTNWF